MSENSKVCTVCTKQTERECSHVECPNRKRVTAQAIGTQFRTSGNDRFDRSVVGEAIVRKPYFFDE